MMDNCLKICWCGRGGQGAITAAKILAASAFASGYSGVAMIPSFGTERRGSPVTISLKLSQTKIYDLSPIETPDIVVILDHLLLDEMEITTRLKPGGLMVLNTPKPPAAHSLKNCRLAAADVTGISLEAGLPYGIVNSGILGAFEKATNLLGLPILLKSIRKEFHARNPQKNALAAQWTYERTVVNHGNGNEKI